MGSLRGPTISSMSRVGVLGVIVIMEEREYCFLTKAMIDLRILCYVMLFVYIGYIPKKPKTFSYIPKKLKTFSYIPKKPEKNSKQL